VQNLRATTAEFSAASKKLDGVMDQAAGAMKDVSATVGHVTATVDKTSDTLAATKAAAISFDKTMVEVRLLVHDARNGKGALGTLIGDRVMAENLKALVANLRARGILWYKDRAEAPAKPAR